MAWTVTINFSNDSMNTRSRNAFASAYGYQDTIDGEPNPQPKAQFWARKIKEFIKGITFAEERKAALAAVADPTIED